MNPTCPDPRCRKRLWQKTAPAATGYPERALLKASEFRILKYKYKLELKRQRAKFRKARIEAIELLSRGAPTGAFAADEWIEVGPNEQPHSQHKTVARHGPSDTIYCKRCGWWSAKAKLRLLATPCQGLKEGNRSSLRLLECGVMRNPGAKVPPQFKKTRSRKGRTRRRW